MKWDPTPGSVRRASVALLCVLAASTLCSRAYTTGFYEVVSAQINQDITTLSAQEEPTRTERILLKTLHRASNALTRTAVADGKTLRTLNTLLGRKDEYAPEVSAVASNLLVNFNAQYEFLGNLIVELPDTAEAHVIEVQYQKFAPTVARLNAATHISKFTALYDGAKRRLDSLLERASEALLVPFPAELSPNSVSARINNQNFRASAGAASDSVFSAATTETGVTVTLGALLTTGGPYPRGLLFSIPEGQLGTFRYDIPTLGSFTNRTQVYSPEENNVAATNGNIFMSVNTNATEVFGTFSCSGPGFEVTDGRFRITISSQP